MLGEAILNTVTCHPVYIFYWTISNGKPSRERHWIDGVLEIYIVQNVTLVGLFRSVYRCINVQIPQLVVSDSSLGFS